MVGGQIDAFIIIEINAKIFRVALDGMKESVYALCVGSKNQCIVSIQNFTEVDHLAVQVVWTYRFLP